MRPVIGVCADSMHAVTRVSKERLEINFVWRRYLEALVQSGAAPLIIPSFEDSSLLEAVIERIDGLLLCGGCDIHPQFYSSASITQRDEEFKPARDAAELQITRLALQRSVPILGICRGGQLINVACGGTLHSHIEGHQHKRSLAFCAHRVRVSTESRLAQLVPSLGMEVNSCHHQAVEQLGAGLCATAYAEDETIEAIELKRQDNFVLGLQWHPEALGDSFSKSIFRTFTAACS